MLIDSIKRYNAESKFKFVDIDVYRAKGIQIPRQIHSIPALFFPDTKATIFQKQVFDFLLLPNKGFLFKQQPSQSLTDNSPFPNQNQSSTDPDSFSFSKTSSSDAYTFIQNDQYVLANDNQRVYNWSDVNASSSPIPAPEETDTKKKNNLPDLSTLQQEREMALQTYLSH